MLTLDTVVYCVGREAQDVEEGEIRAADLDMKRSHAAHWSLNLALYEALAGQAPKAFSSLQAATELADGNLHVSCPCHSNKSRLDACTLPTVHITLSLPVWGKCVGIPA